MTAMMLTTTDDSARGSVACQSQIIFSSEREIIE